MRLPAFEMAKRDARYIGDALRAEPWRREHERAMRVVELERFFQFIEGAVEFMFRVDNQVHLRSAETGNERILKDWIPAFRTLLTVVQKGVVAVERAGRRLKADRYRDAVVTPQRLSLMRSRVARAIRALEEWRA